MLLRHNCNNLYLRSQAFSFALCVMKGSSLNLANESFVEQMMQNAFTRGFFFSIKNGYKYHILNDEYHVHILNELLY